MSVVSSASKQSFWKRVSQQRFLLLLSVPFIIWLVVFKYIPLIGWLTAFQDFKPGFGFFKQEWVGLKHFKELFDSRLFYLSLTNTLAMSVLGLFFGFTTSIFFAVMINELRMVGFKRFTQTVSYLPHFVSWVIVASIVYSMLSTSGPVNGLLLKLGIIKRPFDFMAKPGLFWWLLTFVDVWKETGWNAIIYLAAMAGIDPQLYEAAQIDGANRFQRIWNITLPGIKSTIIILLIMTIGNLINIGFEKQMMLGNTIVQSKALVLDKYALDYGIGLFRFSFGTAIGIFKSVVGLILLFMANNLAKKIGDGRIF